MKINNRKNTHTHTLKKNSLTLKKNQNIGKVKKKVIYLFFQQLFINTILY